MSKKCKKIDTLLLYVDSIDISNVYVEKTQKNRHIISICRFGVHIIDNVTRGRN